MVLTTDPNTPVRTFIAVEPPFAVRAALGMRIEGFKKQAADVKWTETPNLHFTLRFLGDVAPGRMPDALEAVRKACEGVRPFEVRFGGGGAFPDWEKPEALWAAVAEGTEGFTGLAGRVASAFEVAGWPNETRPFVAHLTLGRVRSERGVEAMVRRLQQASFKDIPPFSPASVALFKSLPSAAGSKYERLGEVRLI